MRGVPAPAATVVEEARAARAATTASENVIAVVDCTAFYVSCERVFDASLRGVPVAVLSNNDGCIIARSQEVKDLGIRMGEPYFKCRKKLERAGARVFSSNYALYADMSRRVMETLGAFSDEVEVYSIDEAFLRLPRLKPRDLDDLAHAIRERVYRWTGIPVHVGLGETKTLAKVADELSKAHGGALSLVGHPDRERLMASVDVGDVWGIGPSYRKKLEAQGVYDALALSRLPVVWARRHMTVVGERLVRELQGIECLPLELMAPSRKGICRSRSFGCAVTERGEMERAVATYVSRAAEKLRRYGLVAPALSVFITTKHQGPGPHYTKSATARLPWPTSDTRDLLKAASELVGRIWREGYRYRKAGVLLLDLRPEAPEQTHLFHEVDPKARALMQALDAVNGRFGAGAVRFACAAPSMRPEGHQDQRAEEWQMASRQRSPRYTTEWSELVSV